MKKYFVFILGLFLVSSVVASSVLAEETGTPEAPVVVAETEKPAAPAAKAETGTPEAPVVEAAPAPAIETPAPEASKVDPYGWKPEMIGNLNLSQNEFDNWSAGGEDNLTWQLLLNGKYENQQEKYTWTNSGKLSYGETKTGDADFVKSDDSVKMESVFTYKFGTFLNPYAALKGESQIAPGYDYSTDERVKVSDFLDPGYFTESLGLGYAIGKLFETRLGFAARQTVSDEFALVYSDDSETDDLEKLKSEMGIESVSKLTLKLSDMLHFTSALELFSNLKASDQIDARWENVFTASISKYIQVNLSVALVYDKDISTRRQLKEVLAVGLTYSLFN